MKYCSKSLYLFANKSRFRLAMIWLSEWKVFKFFVLAAVMTNAVIMALHDYKFRIDSRVEEITSFEDVSSKVFVSIFMIEFCIKVVAMGFVMQQNSYLRSGWNVLDFVCLLTGLLELTPMNVDTFMWLRTLRVLKPLRSVKVFPALQKLVLNLFASFVGLINVYMFLGFIMIFFAIFGVNLFAGMEYRSCRTTKELIYIDEADGSKTPIWPKADLDILCNSDQICNDFQPGLVCGSVWESYELDPNKIDDVINDASIMYGVVNFDNFFNAVLTVFQVCTLEGWSKLMYNYADSSSYPFMSYFYFCTLVTIGAFFTLNLILAQIMDTYLIQ